MWSLVAAGAASRHEGGLVTRVTREARDGLMRAWLEILREKHPGVSWVSAAEAGSLEDHPSAKPDRTVDLAT